MNRLKHLTLTTILSGSTAIISGSAPGKPERLSPEELMQFGYRQNPTEPELVIKGAQILTTRINTGSYKPDVSDVIYDETRAPYKVLIHTPEGLRSRQQSYAARVAGKSSIEDEEYGKIRIVSQKDPLYRKIKRLLAQYNKVHPQASVTMPGVIALRDKISNGAQYDLNKDMILYDNIIVRTLNDEEFKALTTHELRHKAHFQSPIPNGVNREIMADTEQQKKFMQFAVTDKHVKDFSPVASTFAEAVYKGERQKTELDADAAAARTVSPTAMLNVLLKIEQLQHSVNAKAVHDPNKMDHPDIKTRAAALGCKIVPDIIAKGQRPSFSALCETPADNAKSR